MAISNNAFELSLDTLAPSGSITRPAQYVNAQTTCTIAKGDATFMCAWFDTNASGTLPDTPTWVAAADNVTSSFSADGIYYGHVCLMDDVNNKSEVYNTASITYDVTLPTVSDVSLDGGEAITKTRNITIDFDFDDNLSGCVSCAISGDINAESTAWSSTLTAAEISAKHVTRNIVLSGSGEEDVTKTVSITVTDASGNTSTAVSDDIILDTEFLQGAIVLRDKADTKNINDQWVNSEDVLVKLVLTDATKGDVVAYKITGDLKNPDADFVTVTKGSAIEIEKKFTDGDAQSKKVFAAVKDDAGNITYLGSKTVSGETDPEKQKYEEAKVDYTAPSVALVIKSSETPYVSKVTGFTTKDLVPTVDGSISGVASYSLTMNDVQYPGATGAVVPANFEVSSANMATGGEKVTYTFKLTVTDNAGNSATSGAVEVYLDTIAPKNGTITMPKWLNGDAADQTTYKKFSTAGGTASAEDAGSGMATMKCWVSATADDEVVPAGATSYTYAANPTHEQIYWGAQTPQSDSLYLHIQYIDNVGNATIYHSGKFGIDTEIPAVGEIKFAKTVYNTQAASVTLTAPVSVAPITRMRIAGDIDNATEDLSEKYTDDKGAVWEAYAGTRAVTLSVEQTPQPSIDREATIVYYDEAGNFGVTPYASDTTELDMVAPSAQVTLFNKDNTASQPAITKVREFNAHITGHEDSGETADPANLEYLLYGDFAITAEAAIAGQGVTEDTAVWTPVTAWDTGKDFKTVGLLYATNPDGEKKVYLKLRDNAGNVTDATPQSFEFDTEAPEVVVTNIDHNRISKVHEFRLTHQEHETRHYADETKFTFSSDDTFQAYKVCAYLDEAAARKDYPGDDAGFEKDEWVEAQVAIPTTAGSVNMSATGLTQTEPIACTIKGADYEAALGEIGKVDGTHFVVVYIEDMGGSWSVAASFTA